MVDFGRICRDDGSFMVYCIDLDRSSIVKVFGENGTLTGLPFFVSEKGTSISECWTRGEAQIGHFYTMSLQLALRFPFIGFILEMLNDYGIALPTCSECLEDSRGLLFRK